MPWKNGMAIKRKVRTLQMTSISRHALFCSRMCKECHVVTPGTGSTDQTVDCAVAIAARQLMLPPKVIAFSSRYDTTLLSGVFSERIVNLIKINDR